MATYRDRAIPIKKVEVGEGDLLLELLTENHGLIQAVAPGVRKIKSRKRGNIEVGTLSSFSLAEGKSRDIVVEAQMENCFENIRKSSEGLDLIFDISKTAGYIFGSADYAAFAIIVKTLELAERIGLSDERAAELYKWVLLWFKYNALLWGGMINEIEEMSGGFRALKSKKTRDQVKELTERAMRDIILDINPSG